jgi:hypothetical protein
VKLTPRTPPGRLSRKALAFESEIHRLRSEGHSCAAIHLALADAGLCVSRSTVKREVKRCAQHPQIARRSIQEQLAPPRPAPRLGAALVGDPRTGKEIAEDFMKGRISNPLLRARAENSPR